MASIKTALGGVTAITLGGASLGSYAAREGTLVVNTTNLYLDAMISGTLTMGAAVSLGDCYLLLSASDATNITTPATGSDAAIVVPQLDKLGSDILGQPHPGCDLIFFYRINCTGAAAAAVIKYYVPIGVASAFDGNLPPQWAPVLVNCTGQALSSSATVTNYNGVSATSV